jgi:segregation and condensation protein B
MSTEASSIDAVHALLFVADSPATVETLAAALGYTEGQVEQALEALEERLSRDGPIMLVRIAGGYQLSTKPEHADRIGLFLQPQRQRIGKSLMEVLAVVAYRQPLTIAEIDSVRGVQSDYAVRGLVERRLIMEVGRKKLPGRPILYGTTQQFLHKFNLDTLKELPPLEGPGGFEAALDVT